MGGFGLESPNQSVLRITADLEDPGRTEEIRNDCSGRKDPELRKTTVKALGVGGRGRGPRREGSFQPI